MPEQLPVPLDAALLRRAVEHALEEDGAGQDQTTQSLVAPAQAGAGTIVAKATGVVCGLPVAQAVFAALDPAIHFKVRVAEGGAIAPGVAICGVYGGLEPILSGERVALNFLQRLSGIATATRQLVDTVAGLDVRIADTRKTAPGLRALERYAVRVGGGHNHRFNLRDGVLIKDNHLVAARARGLTIANIIDQVRRSVPHTMRVEIEVTSPEEAAEAVAAGADVILLDNMPPKEMRRVVKATKGRALIEASGGVTLKNVRAIAETGVNVISAGAITHSAPALDMSLEVEG